MSFVEHSSGVQITAGELLMSRLCKFAKLSATSINGRRKIKNTENVGGRYLVTYNGLDNISQQMCSDIMIVDDRPENVRLLSTILDNAGYRTRKSINPIFALQAIELDPPSLILLDIKMPVMTGFEVCQLLKSNPKTAQIPIIFLSAENNDEYRLEAFKVGGADYLSKPFHAEEVLARVKTQLKIVAAEQKIMLLTSELEKRLTKDEYLENAIVLLTEMAFQDSLTKLPNRRLVIKRLQEAIEEQQVNDDYQFAALYLDCNNFKSVNDSLGHRAGDELLIEISCRLKSVVRHEDLVARVGGDEFVILLFNSPNPDTVSQIAERILHVFSIPFTLQGEQVFVSFSVGIVSDCRCYTDPEEILQNADAAMYQAKSSTKQQKEVFSFASVINYADSCR